MVLGHTCSALLMARPSCLIKWEAWWQGAHIGKTRPWEHAGSAHRATTQRVGCYFIADIIREPITCHLPLSHF